MICERNVCNTELTALNRTTFIIDSVNETYSGLYCSMKCAVIDIYDHDHLGKLIKQSQAQKKIAFRES